MLFGKYEQNANVATNGETTKNIEANMPQRTIKNAVR